MRQIVQPWINISMVITKSRVVQEIKGSTMTKPRKASFLITWCMYWYVLTTVILMIVHAQL